MVRSRRGAVIGIILVMLFVASFGSVYWLRRSWVKIGEHRIRLNPSAKINPEKQYKLRFWDYDLPLHCGDQSYSQYLQHALDDFQQMYPNIQVQLKLLDLLEGPGELQQALAVNEGPDVYGSFYENPVYDFRHQIPVGLFLKDKERNAYPETIRSLQSIDGILCALPRWLSVDIWVGNRRLLEDCGGDVKAIQQQGWGWNELLEIADRLPEKTYLLAGHPITADLTRYLYHSTKRDGRGLAAELGALQALIEKRRISPGLEKNMLTEFITGQAALLAGVRAAILTVFAQKAMASGGNAMSWEAVWLPAPRCGDGSEVQFADGGFLTVYRHRATQGDDQVAAAVKLALFLSNYPERAPWMDFGVLPVSAIAGELTGIADFLNQLISRSDLAGKHQRTEVETLINAWLRGQLDSKEFETNIATIFNETSG